MRKRQELEALYPAGLSCNLMFVLASVGRNIHFLILAGAQKRSVERIHSALWDRIFLVVSTLPHRTEQETATVRANLLLSCSKCSISCPERVHKRLVNQSLSAAQQTLSLDTSTRLHRTEEGTPIMITNLLLS